METTTEPNGAKQSQTEPNGASRGSFRDLPPGSQFKDFDLSRKVQKSQTETAEPTDQFREINRDCLIGKN